MSRRGELGKGCTGAWDPPHPGPLRPGGEGTLGRGRVLYQRKLLWLRACIGRDISVVPNGNRRRAQPKSRGPAEPTYVIATLIPRHSGVREASIAQRVVRDANDIPRQTPIACATGVTRVLARPTLFRGLLRVN